MVVNEAQELLAKLLSGEDVKDISFEQGLKALELLVEKVETGSLPLAQTLEAYERGTVVVQRLRDILNQAEEKISVLKKS